MISSAPETTWLAVRTYPSGLTITPEPRPCRVCLPCLCGSFSSEELAQCVVTKWKRCLPARNSLRSKDCYNARRDLLNNRCERRDKPLLRGTGFLRCG